ncbi:type II toxin-antitoxin system RelB/DinJ family antitoxin [Lactococcus laudensis]|jgi:addiction module RelB/DinJ family antitoxin|uniref:Type II toxin-antitoxin system RelB/DinJ family antitoxin n=2 Tax=Pseudolactococcus TaxID=3436058 RepID=A0AAE6YMY7_9LACT|nr:MULTISPECIES: type II toxin-antitoxin system RelB/DinJ family antitoxin [Lactococcus]MBA0017463.1 type II toxin-antitoxin system RelB/DinJ family antitoxin [Lactococcus laudensis]MBR2588346.1 type II toxin-antitoxin system RelB/DinJ family antitoxin [Bacilli bacterium]MBW9282418.1 type II toxin-antitoxin system RelB/DinJ family antitoxin [Lactococcus laudensis]QIW59055.1 type II toxin-antitoxin system RelB/DinJ family antitoxin [Lactococcus raffinolactis]
MTTIQKTYRIDEDLQQKAEQYFSEMGLNPTVAITMFFKRVVDEKKMPFIPEVISERVDYSMESKNKLSALISKIPVENISDMTDTEKAKLLDGWEL